MTTPFHCHLSTVAEGRIPCDAIQETREETALAADMALAQYRAARAVEMRMAGAEYDQIAKELGFANRSGACKAAQRALRQRTASAVDRYRMIRYAELEDIHRRWWSVALAGDLSAITRVIAASTERALLTGTYDPGADSDALV